MLAAKSGQLNVVRALLDGGFYAIDDTDKVCLNTFNLTLSSKLQSERLHGLDPREQVWPQFSRERAAGKRCKCRHL